MAAVGREATNDHPGDAAEAAALRSQLIAIWEPRGEGQLEVGAFEDAVESMTGGTVHNLVKALYTLVNPYRDL